MYIYFQCFNKNDNYVQYHYIASSPTTPTSPTLEPTTRSPTLPTTEPTNYPTIDPTISASPTTASPTNAPTTEPRYILQTVELDVEDSEALLYQY